MRYVWNMWHSRYGHETNTPITLTVTVQNRFLVPGLSLLSFIKLVWPVSDLALQGGRQPGSWLGRSEDLEKPLSSHPYGVWNGKKFYSWWEALTVHRLAEHA